MTAERRIPGLPLRCIWVIGSAAIVAIISLGLVDLIPQRRPDAGPGANHQESREKQRPRAPDLVGGLGELSEQALLVAGIAFAGRTILRIRL
ncbi:MAG TPA: hypothetical protein VGL65_03500 [Gemmatimonadales bacterium]|jgi:uncharacterized iron-regulated membrane protein